MKKILYVRKAPDSGINGTTKYCDALYNLFAKDPDCQPLPIENYPTRKSRLFHYYYQLKPLYRAFKAADIIHINGYTDMGTVEAFLIARWLKKQIVYTAHWHPFCRLTHPVGGKIFFNVFLRPLVHFFAQSVVCINNEDSAYFSTFTKHIKRIPHWFVPRPMTKYIERKPNMILFVGRLNDPVKGIEYLYDLPEGKYDIHCVGYGELPHKRSDMTHHYNLTDDELATLYRQASLLVIPSMYEAFSYVALEAFSYETPVVMSDRVRIADYLDGVKGYKIFKFGNHRQFVDSVAETIGQPVDREKVMQIFNIDRIFKLYKQLYMEPKR